MGSLLPVVQTQPYSFPAHTCRPNKLTCGNWSFIWSTYAQVLCYLGTDKIIMYSPTNQQNTIRPCVPTRKCKLHFRRLAQPSVFSCIGLSSTCSFLVWDFSPWMCSSLFHPTLLTSKPVLFSPLLLELFHFIEFTFYFRFYFCSN